MPLTCTILGEIGRLILKCSHYILFYFDAVCENRNKWQGKKNEACSLNPLTLQWLDDVAISYNTALAFFVTWSYINTVTVCRIEFLQYSSVWCMAYIICTLPVGKKSVEDILSWSAFPRRLFCRLQERLTERKITKTLLFKTLTKGGGGGVSSYRQKRSCDCDGKLFDWNDTCTMFTVVFRHERRQVKRLPLEIS